MIECAGCGTENEGHCKHCGCTADVNESALDGLLYGVVQWINGNPAIDGLLYFETKKKALKYANERRECIKELPKVAEIEYTIIRLQKAT